MPKEIVGEIAGKQFRVIREVPARKEKNIHVIEIEMSNTYTHIDSQPIKNPRGVVDKLRGLLSKSK